MISRDIETNRECAVGKRNSTSCLALFVYVRSSSVFAEKISVSSLHVDMHHVHAGQSVIYDHRRALKASRLSLLNASYSVCSSGRLLIYPFFALSLFISYVTLLVHVVRYTCTHVNSREYTRTRA